jgi:hypothetical protein
MFTGPQFPNNEPDPNLPNMGIHPAPPSELAPQLGQTVYPGDEGSTEKSGDLSPPATAGAEQDMQPANHDVSKYVGATAVPEVSTEPSTSQPEEPADNPQLSKQADAPESPETPVAAGGDGPADPPEPPNKPPASMFPEREPIPAPDLYALGERTPTVSEALAATAGLEGAIIATLEKHAEYIYGNRLDLNVPTEDGYFRLRPTVTGKITVERHRFRAEKDLQAANSIAVNYYPTEVYKYSPARSEVGQMKKIKCGP